MTKKMGKQLKICVTASVMSAVMAVSAMAVNVTAVTDAAVRAKSSSAGTQIATMKEGTTRKVLGSTKTWYKVKVNGKTGYVKKRDVKEEAAGGKTEKTDKTNPVKTTDIAEAAKQLLGKPYAQGGQGPDAFDCSGFCMYVYKQCGKTIPRSTSEQYKSATKIKREDLKSGDIVFFNDGSKKGAVTYDGIYIGNDQIISVSTKNGVVTGNLKSGYYNKYFVSGGRF